jgi:predicted RNA-binding protein
MKILLCFLLFLCFSGTYAQEVQLANRQPYRYRLLYWGCANELSILTNGKYNIEDLSFQAENAEIQVDREKGIAMVIPQKRDVAIHIFHKNTLLQKEKYLLRFSIAPQIYLLIGKEQTAHRLGQSVAKEKLTAITFQARLESNIALDIPLDCQYQITHLELFLTRGEELIGEPMVSIYNTINLENLMKNAQKGDRLVAYIKKVERLTHKGTWEEAWLYKEDQIISLGIE